MAFEGLRQRLSMRLQLFLTSFAILLFELACIRWIPAHVRYLGYFINFILLASFLGIGAGILAGRSDRLRLPPFPVFLFLLVVGVLSTRYDLPVTSTQGLFFAPPEGEGGVNRYWVVPLLFTLVAVSFVPLARPLARLFTGLPPLQAYAVDIAGSLAGIAAFFLMSYLSLPPVVWFGALGCVLLPLLRWRVWLRTLPLTVGAVLLVYLVTGPSIWSPYYRIEVHRKADGHIITVNTIAHQETHLSELNSTFYFEPYDLLGHRPFPRVLVIGAGMGADAGIALRHGAERVDAVEIDPVIHQLGRSLHPERPYDDPRVHVTIDDGRAFLRNTDQRYDLIIFALTDSLTLTSAFSNLRLESFLLTAESIATARDHLSDDGVLVLYNYYREDWLVSRLAGMVTSAFGEPPFVTAYGAWGRAAVLMAGPRLKGLDPALNVSYPGTPAARTPGSGLALPMIGYGRFAGDGRQVPATDDWPFIYLQNRGLPGIYLIGLVTVAVVAALLLRIAASVQALRRFNWHFFFLGVAFMLLETRSLVAFALLFGTTWLVNSMVFFAILASVLAAVLVNARFKELQARPLYLGLFAALLVAFLLPPEALLGIDVPALRYVVASLVAFAPIFLANLVFSRSFRDTGQADVAFASNLIGAMVGGMLEYAALITGYHSLLVVIAVCYGLAWLVNRRSGATAVQPALRPA